jgi:uncharacterized protein (TIGR00255 family)
MIRSMTGYGSAGVESAELRAVVNARSLNHRFLDVTLHLPRRLQPLELELRERITRALRRGRVEVVVQVAAAEIGTAAVVPSRPLVASLVRALRDMQNEFGLEGGASVSDLVRFPGALERAEDLSAPGQALRDAVAALLAHALEDLDATRRAEGERLLAELLGVIDRVEAAAARIAERSSASRAERCSALRQRIAELLAETGLEETKLYQEAVRAVERHDVAEELQRLRSHTAAVRGLMADEGDAPAPGKRLDFLAQELMREANTIGSKVQDAAAIHDVVELKSEIERFREQVQNVE